jgi:hypothetical protein
MSGSTDNYIIWNQETLSRFRPEPASATRF